MLHYRIIIRMPNGQGMQGSGRLQCFNGHSCCINAMLRSLTENYEEEQNDRGDSVEALIR